jgi:hypothetical protein
MKEAKMKEKKMAKDNLCLCEAYIILNVVMKAINKANTIFATESLNSDEKDGNEP